VDRKRILKSYCTIFS